MSLRQHSADAGTPPAPKKSTSPQRKRASKANGQKGGRPRDDRHMEDFDRLGPAPIGKPLALARWVQNVLAIDLERQIQGRDHHETSVGLRSTSIAIFRGIPADITFEAERLILADGQDLEAEDGPEPEEIDAEGERTSSLSCTPPRS